MSTTTMDHVTISTVETGADARVVVDRQSGFGCIACCKSRIEGKSDATRGVRLRDQDWSMRAVDAKDVHVTESILSP